MHDTANDTTITFRISRDLANLVRDEAERQGVSQSAMIRIALRGLLCRPADRQMASEHSHSLATGCPDTDRPTEQT